MNRINLSFERAQSLTLRDMLNIPAADQRDYLVVTALDLYQSGGSLLASPHNVFSRPLDRGNEATEMLNAVSLWIRNAKILDQRTMHGDNRKEYNISLYRIPAGRNVYPSLAADFYLQDYLFSHNRPEELHSFDDLMWSLDRHKFGAGILDCLKNDFDMPTRENAPHFWLRDLSMSSHPQYERQQALVPA